MVTKKIKNRLGLGKKSSWLLSELAENNKNIFTVDDVVNILKDKKPSVTKLLHDLTRKKWLFRLSKGTYLIFPLDAGVKPEFTEHELIIASHLIFPYYVSYWSALNYYGLTEQVSKTIFIAALKRKRETEIKGLKFKFITINKYKFFGFSKVLIDNRLVNLAEKEKAIVDCLDFLRYCGGIAEVIKALDGAKEELDLNKLKAYAQKMKNTAILNRLGYILELLNIKNEIKPGKQYVLLDPISHQKGTYNKKWKVIVNVSKEELLSWREH